MYSQNELCISGDKMFYMYLFLTEIESESWMLCPYGGTNILEFKIEHVKLKLCHAVEVGDFAEDKSIQNDISNIVESLGLRSELTAKMNSPAA